jgi:RNA polymerase-binding transcription factor DksA
MDSELVHEVPSPVGAEPGHEVTAAVADTTHEVPGPSEVSIDEVDRLLDQVELALTRLDDGTYGRCGSCGSPIDDALLAASPTARDCGNCAALTED